MSTAHKIRKMALQETREKNTDCKYFESSHVNRSDEEESTFHIVKRYFRLNLSQVFDNLNRNVILLHKKKRRSVMSCRNRGDLTFRACIMKVSVLGDVSRGLAIAVTALEDLRFTLYVTETSEEF